MPRPRGASRCAACSKRRDRFPGRLQGSTGDTSPCITPPQSCAGHGSCASALGVHAGGVNGRSALPPLGSGGLLASFAASSHYSSGRACAGAECGAPRECYPLLKRMQRAIRAHATETCQCRRVPITAALYSAPHAPRFSERIIDLRRGTRCAAGAAGVMRGTWRLVAGGRHLDVSAGRDY